MNCRASRVRSARHVQSSNLQTATSITIRPTTPATTCRLPSSHQVLSQVLQLQHVHPSSNGSMHPHAKNESCPVDLLSSKPFANVFPSHDPIAFLPPNSTTESAASSSGTLPHVMSRPSSPPSHSCDLSTSSWIMHDFNLPGPAVAPHSLPGSHGQSTSHVFAPHTILSQTRPLCPSSCLSTTFPIRT
ncbi:hypothetical protein ID866_9127 [Astraeus odoratus]|nr:hypothetical protein ID866_9127 [Astraeus odoratus]